MFICHTIFDKVRSAHIILQAKGNWFTVTGADSVLHGHYIGASENNGTLTIKDAPNARVSHFNIDTPPASCITVTNSSNLTFEGLMCNGTETTPDV